MVPSGICFRGFGFFLTGGDLRQTEIENFRVTPLGNKNIRWFNVSMNNPLRVRRLQRLRNFRCQRK